MEEKTGVSQSDGHFPLPQLLAYTSAQLPNRQLVLLFLSHFPQYKILFSDFIRSNLYPNRLSVQLELNTFVTGRFLRNSEVIELNLGRQLKGRSGRKAANQP